MTRVHAEQGPSPAARWSMLQRSCACGSSCTCGSPAPPARGLLPIGEPGTAHEREADAIADRMTGRASATSLQRSAITPVHATSARRSADVPGAARASASAAPVAPGSVHDVLATSGAPLDGGSRAWFESRFGRDFSRVRIHADTQAARSAEAIGARAYTVGPHVVFGAGRYAPDRQEGRRLLAHELTHVVQQGESGELVQRDLIFGSGYKNPFDKNPSGEAAAAQKGEWFPSSVDFKDTAALSGGGKGLSTLKGLITEIGSKAVGSVSDIDLVGHANGDLFALGGTITTTSVSGSADGTIGASQLAAVQGDIDKVRDRFAKGAHITIYGCNSGASGTLLAAISESFKVCARGFKDAITWCLGWSTNPITINSRGRTLINPPENTPCSGYNASVYSLTTDVEDCSGTKPKPPAVDLPKREPKVPEVPE